MKKIIALFTLVLSGFLTAAVSAEANVNPYGALLIGDGIKVEMAKLSDKNEHGLNDVVVRLSGEAAYDAGYDGKYFLLKAVPAGTGFDLRLPNGDNMMGNRQRGGWFGSWTSLDIYLGTKSIALMKVEGESINGQHLYGAYQTWVLQNSEKAK